MTKTKKNLGLGTITLALIFLFNPNVTVIDVLPDFVGYALLCAGLAQLGDLHESIGAAVSVFRKMIFVDALKLLAILWIFGMTVPVERSSSILLFTFVFGALEMILLIPAYQKLFRGINELGYFYPNTSIFEDQNKKKGKNRTDRMQRSTITFVCVKAILTFLPELADLSQGTYDETAMASTENLYRFVGLLRAMAFLPVLVVGIVWLCRAIRYFSDLRRDDSLMSALQTKYDTKIRPKVGLFAQRRLKITFSLLMIALALTLDLRMDSQNMLPDFLAAAVFAVLLWQMRQTKRRWSWLGAVIPYFALSAFAGGVENYFFAHYRYGVLIKNDTALLTYVILTVANALKGIAFLAVIALVIRGLSRIVAEHTGYVVGRESHNNNEEKMIKDQQDDLNRGLRWAGTSAVLYVLSDVCYDLFVPRVGFFVVIPTVFGAVCLLLFARALWAIQDAVQTKYMLE